MSPLLKRCVFLFIPVVLILSLSPFMLSARSVVVVYDDSKSMEEEGDRWYYANYAMQALTALLGDDDNLYVVRMSRPADPIDLGSMDKSVAINRILNEFTNEGGTPYQSVETAMDVLYELYDEDSWLIILSDGEFNEEYNPDRYGQLDMDELQFEISDFIAETGTKTIFLLIGDESLKERESIESWQQNAQAEVLTAGSRRQITDKMQYIAEQVSSRSKGQVGTVRERTLTVDTPFPLHRLTLLDQGRVSGELFEVERAVDANGDPLITEDTFSMQTPTGSPETIHSKITHIRERRRDQVIPEGEIKVEFSDSLTSSSFLILPDVALSFDVFLTDKDGEPLQPNEKGVYVIYEDQRIIVNGQLIHSGSGEPVELRKIADKIDKLQVEAFYNTEAPVELELIEPREALFTNAISFPEGEHRISASAEFPGYFNFKSNIFTIRAEHYYRTLGIEDGEDWSGGQLALDEAGTLIRPQADGLTVSAEEFAQWPKPEISSPGSIWFEVEPEERGWRVRPKPFLWEPLFTSTGEIPVEFELRSHIDGESGSATVRLQIEPAPFFKVLLLFLAKLLALIALIWYLIGIIKKPRFARRAKITAVKKRYTGRESLQQTTTLKSGVLNRWLVPYLPEKKYVYPGFIFEADKMVPGKILLLESSLGENKRLKGPKSESRERKGYIVFDPHRNTIVTERRDDTIEYKYEK